MNDTKTKTKTITRGKYAGLSLPYTNELSDKPDYQAKVAAIKAAFLADPNFKLQATALARAYVQLRREKDDLNDELYVLNMRLAAVSQMMTDQFEAEDVDVIRVDGRPVAVNLEPSVKVTNKAEFRDWCLEDPDLASQMMLWPTTTEKLIRDMLLAGKNPPPGTEALVTPWIRLGPQA